MELLKLQNGSDIRGVAMPGIAGEDVNLNAEAVETAQRIYGGETLDFVCADALEALVCLLIKEKQPQAGDLAVRLEERFLAPPALLLRRPPDGRLQHEDPFHPF